MNNTIFTHLGLLITGVLFLFIYFKFEIFRFWKKLQATEQPNLGVAIYSLVLTIGMLLQLHAIIDAILRSWEISYQLESMLLDRLFFMGPIVGQLILLLIAGYYIMKFLGQISTRLWFDRSVFSELLVKNLLAEIIVFAMIFLTLSYLTSYAIQHIATALIPFNSAIY